MSSPGDTADRPHLPALDGARGLAILLVLVFHFGALHNDRDWRDHWWTRLFAGGWCGVDLFFVLSGCLITGILLDVRGGPRYFRNFYARRALRIFPLYYGFLILVFLARPLLALSVEDAAALRSARPWLWLYGQNLWIAVARRGLPAGVNHLWSLAIEEQFYLVWPFVVWLCSRRALAWVCGGLVVGCLAVRVALTAAGTPPFVVYVLTIARLDGFAAGAAVALALRGGFDPARLTRLGRAVAVTCLAGVVALAAGRRGCLAWNDPRVQTVGFTLLLGGFAGLLAWGVTAPAGAVVRRALEFRPLRRLARYSYSVYLLHFPLGRVFHDHFRPDVLPAAWRPAAGGWFGLATLAAASATAIGLGVATWHLFEKHVLRLKAYFPQAAAEVAPQVEQRRAA